MTGPTAHDVIVAGAGPAGSAAAIVARLAGLRVALLDDADGERLAVGESLPGAVVRSLRRLGIEGPGALSSADEIAPCVANVSAWGEERWSYRDALDNPEGGGWHVLRHRFDAGLRDHAAALGVERIHGRAGDIVFREGLSHVSVSCGDGSPARTLEARFVVDATGRHAAISRKQGVKRRRLSEQLAAVGWLRHPEDDVDQTTRLKSVEDGWWYTARLPKGLRVVAFHGLPHEVAQRMRRPETFAERCNAAGLLPYEVRPSELVEPLRAVDAGVQTGEQVAGPGWLAVGDAALSFDPLSSQGVLFALYSGIRGGEAVIQCLGRPALAERLLDDYEQKVRGVLAANQRARRLFYASERRYPESAYWRAQHHASIADTPDVTRPGPTP